MSQTDPLGRDILPCITWGVIPVGRGRWQSASVDGNSYPRSEL